MTVESRSFLMVMFLSHATCSVSMVLLNKTLALGFDYPWTVVFIQNIGTVLLGYVWPLLFGDDRKKEQTSSSTSDIQYNTFLGLKIPKAYKNKLWVVAQTFWFCLTLFFSLKALRFIPVPLYVVARNTVPAVTAGLEYFFTGIVVKKYPIVGLAMTVIGAVVYTASDLFSASLDFIGFLYAIALVFIVAACSVVDKTAVRRMLDEEKISVVESNQNRVALSMPINILCIAVFELYKPNNALDNAGKKVGSKRILSTEDSDTNPEESSATQKRSSSSTSLANVSSDASRESWFRRRLSAHELLTATANTLTRTLPAILTFGGILMVDESLHVGADSQLLLPKAQTSGTSSAQLLGPSEASQLIHGPNIGERRFLQGNDFIAHDIGSGEGMPVMVRELLSLTPTLMICMILSTIFGFGMGTFNFYLQQAVAAATVQVANILYKLTTTMISRVTHPSPVGWSSWLGFFISLAGIALYTFGNRIQDYLEPEEEQKDSHHNPDVQKFGRVEMQSLTEQESE